MRGYCIIKIHSSRCSTGVILNSSAGQALLRRGFPPSASLCAQTASSQERHLCGDCFLARTSFCAETAASQERHLCGDCCLARTSFCAETASSQERHFVRRL